MRRGHFAGIEAAPACAQMLIGANEIGCAGRGVEALRENPRAVEKIFTDDGAPDAVRHVPPSVAIVRRP